MKNEETAKRLKLAMDNKNLTAKQLSDKPGVSEPSISQYVHGTFAPRNQTAAKLAKILQVNPMWLMGFDVPMEENRILNKILEGNLKKDNMVNKAVVMSLDDIYRDLSPEQIELVRLFAQFLREKNVGNTEKYTINGFDPSILDDKKDGE